MDTVATLLLFLGLLLAAVGLEKLSNRAQLPFALILLLLGWLASQLITLWQIDTGLRWHNIYDLIYYVFLPILIFEAALNIDTRALMKNLVPVLFLAVPVLLLSAGTIAILVYYGIGHPTGFPWIAALMVGALLSATDPAAVFSLFKNYPVPDNLRLLLEGESLLNDAAAVALFGLILGLATQTSDMQISEAAVAFIRLFGGGIILGLIVALISRWVFPLLKTIIPVSVVTLVFAYTAFLLAEYLRVSGVITILIVGIGVGHVTRSSLSSELRGFLLQLWQYKSWLANALLFLIAGMTIQISMFTSQWLAILIAICGVLLSRALGIYLVFPMVRYLPIGEPVPPGHRGVIYWGGVRGSIVMALALSLPLDLPYWWTIQSMAYGVVVFSLLVQATSMPLVLKQAFPDNNKG